ncbi:MAG: MFS transporter [Pirellulaceae bacterium]
MSDGASNRGKLMWASFLTLIAAGMGFAVRGGVLAEWSDNFGFTQFELGTITGGGLLGFGIVIMLASLITDHVGYKPILMTAFALHLLSALITISATPIFNAAGKDATYQCLYWGMFMFAVANGLCEAVINPLVATVYREKKTHYLNILHAGWPGGLIIGGLLGAAIVGKVPWEIPIALYIIPTLWYGFIVLKEPFPTSDAKRAGLTFGGMLSQFASPLLLFLLLLHACVGYVELGTDSWITNITESILTGQGFFLFVYASSIMFILRFFAGPIVERINPLGLLCLSTILGTTGLYLLGSVKAAALVWIAVTIYGVGKTFLWPTMLGIVGERFPRGGAITMGAMGGIGMLSAGLLGGPGIGYKQDLNASNQLKGGHPETYTRYAAAKEDGFLMFPKVKGLDGQKVGVLLDSGGPAATLNSDHEILVEQGEPIPPSIANLKQWWDSTGSEYQEVDREPVEQARIYGGRKALQWTAVVPAAMFFGYLLLVIYFRTQGGYRTVEIDSEGHAHLTDHKPTAEEAIEDGEEGLTSGQA